MDKLIFIDGMKVKQKFDGLLGVSINLENFNKFAEEYKNKGYLNVDICRSKEKENTWYARLNTWKPDKTKAESKSESDEIDETEIPF